MIHRYVLAAALAIWAVFAMAAMHGTFHAAYAHEPEVGPLPPRPAAQVGGEFNLVSHTGQPVTVRDFRGRILLVFFGFTYCPDVCPLSMHMVAVALDKLAVTPNEVTVLFITVDPERDTAEVLANYVANIHPNLVGLTGSDAQIAAAAKAYHVRYGPREARNDGGAEEDYLVDHSAYIYVMGTDGEYRHAFHYRASADEIAGKLNTLLEAQAH